MELIRQKLLETTLRNLNNLGLKYALQSEDGAILGSLPVQPEPPPGYKARATRKDYKALGISAFIKGMRIAEVRVFDVAPWIPQGHTVECVAGNISSHGVTAFGRGNFTVCRNKNTVECMRTG